MSPNNTAYLKRSAYLGLLLFFLLPLASLAESALRDTIIIDGKLLIVEQEVTYDTLPSAKTERPVKRNYGNWRFGWQFEGGSAMSNLKFDFDGFESVNEFSGNPTRFGPAAGFSVLTEKKMRKGWTVNAAAGVDRWSAPVRTFDTNQLDDSLFRFYSPEKGRIDQITLYRYELGEEYDTLQLKLSESAVNINFFHFRIQAGKEVFLQKDRVFRFAAGAEFLLALSSTKPDMIFIPNQGSQILRYQSENTYAIKKTLVVPRLEIGYRLRIDKSLWFDVGLFSKLLIHPLESNQTPISLNGSTFGVSLAVLLYTSK